MALPGDRGHVFRRLLTAYAVYRIDRPAGVALASRASERLAGVLNTVVLLTSSLTMALAVRCRAVRDHRAHLVGWLLATMFLGTAFLGIKAIEYTAEYHEQLVPGWNFQVPEHDRSAGRAGPDLNPSRCRCFLFFISS